MSEQQKPKEPIKNLEELRSLLDSADDVIVDPSGSIHSQNDPKVADKPPDQRTALKPQRWFARP